MPSRAAAMVVLVLAAAGPLAARSRGVPAAVPAGKPIDCVRTIDIDSTRLRDDRTIDFYMRGGRVYRNMLPQTCPDLGFEEAFGYETSIDQLCSVDIITVLHRGGGAPYRGASCGLGRFQPVTIADPAKRR